MSPRCVKTLAMIVSLGIRRLPLTSMSSMIWPVWAETWDATGKPVARRTAASDTHLAMEISFKLPLKPQYHYPQNSLGELRLYGTHCSCTTCTVDFITFGQPISLRQTYF